uniref:C2H2-type domain-containing protein n=1 Tax=Plectus sambesii TaxID=2011161 RepID=A0A914V1C2_9BILA
MSVARRKSIFATINDLVGLSEDARVKPDALDLRVKGDEPSVVHQPMPILASVAADVGFFDGSFMLKAQQKPPMFSFYPWMQAPTSPSVSYQSLLLLSAAASRDHQQMPKSAAPIPTIGSVPLPSSHGSRSCESSRSASTPRCQLKLPAHPPNSLNLLPANGKQSGQRHAPRFQCADCNRSYSTFSGLSKHRQFHCTSQLKRHFACKYCEKQYSSLGALKMHIRTHTLPCEKPFCCAHCGRAFADRSNLRAHLQTHSDIKKYSCKSCLKTFSRMSLLTKHENNGCPSLMPA